MQVQLAASAESAQEARIAVSDFLVSLGRADLIDDVTLIATELVANAIMHARTELTLSVSKVGTGVRVSVSDRSPILPRWTPASVTATAGRGLLLVEQLSGRWGFDPLPEGGKCVWAEIDQPAQAATRSDQDLLDAWSDEPWPAQRIGDQEVEVVLDIDVQAMLDSRAHTEELVRDLQLTLLDAADGSPSTGAEGEVVRLAQRLDSANEDFHEARRQIYNQTISADKHRLLRTSLHLSLLRADAAPARRWLAALDEADALTAAGTLLLPPFPAELTAFRRHYIGAIISQLEAAG